MSIFQMDERVVLSVEDSDADFYLLQMAIKEADIAVQVCRVQDGEEALCFLERSGKHAGAPRPHLILLNINMPRRNGLEVLEYIRSHESVREIPVVMFTTSSDGTDRKRALALGAEAFLTKPLTYDQLITDLSAVCARFLRPSHTRSDRKELGEASAAGA